MGLSLSMQAPPRFPRANDDAPRETPHRFRWPPRSGMECAGPRRFGPSAIAGPSAPAELPGPLDESDPNPLLATYLARRADLVRYFRVRLRSDEAAEDLVQDIYVKITSLPAERIDNPSGFLFRLGSNLMLDQIKQRKRSGRRDAEWRQANTTSTGREDVSEASAADTVADARQRLARIIEVVKDLPPPVQEAFRLHKLEGLTHTETAAAMNISKSSVEKYMMTCLKRILARVGR